jgi:hypothetical protein
MKKYNEKQKEKKRKSFKKEPEVLGKTDKTYSSISDRKILYSCSGVV